MSARQIRAYQIGFFAVALAGFVLALVGPRLGLGATERLAALLVSVVASVNGWQVGKENPKA